MKTIPVSYKTQLLIKVGIPFVLSFVSFLITILVLVISGVISFITFVFALILVTILLITYEIVSLKEELSIRNRKPRSTFISNLYSYALPIVYFGVTAVLSFYSIPLVLAFIIGVVVLVGILIPNIIHIKKNMNSLFMDLDVIN